MKLKTYLELHFKLTKQRQSPWAVEHDMAPCTITRALLGDVSLKQAVRISKATHGQVGVLELAPWVKELLPDYKPE